MAKTSESDPKRRLGRGLSSLIGEIEAQPVESKAVEIPQTPMGTREILITDIRANPNQPRRHFDSNALQELSDSIAAKGILQPILLRNSTGGTTPYEIVAGERRFRAAQMAGLTSIPAVVKDVDELDLLEFGIIENVQREDLNPMEEAEAYSALMKRFGRTQESLAASIGKSRSHIANTLRLLNLPDEVRDYVREGRLSAGHARAILASDDPIALAEKAVNEQLSVRAVEALAKAGLISESPKNTATAKSLTEHDIDARALEADLSRALGLVVEVKSSGNGGQLRIHYKSLAQLDDVCRKLN